MHFIVLRDSAIVYKNFKDSQVGIQPVWVRNFPRRIAVLVEKLCIKEINLLTALMLLTFFILYCNFQD